MAEWDITDIPRLSTPVRDADGDLIDPTALTVTVRAAGMADVVYSWPTGSPAAVNEDVGLFHADHPITVAGWHTYEFSTTGTGQAREGGQFYARASVLDLDAMTLADLDLIRLLVPDNDPLALLFTDRNLLDLLTLEGGVKLAAAQALDIAASSEAMVSKVIRTQDGLSTDGPKVAAELRARAKGLREQAAEAVANDDDTTSFAIADFDYRWPVP